MPSLVTIGVSEQLGELKSKIVRLGSQLESKLHDTVARFVDEGVKQLESHVCKIAFVGQVKAGKSSLINALVQRPGLLPTDVNPSTAVVTMLYIGSASHPDNTALFHFFSKDEWDTLLSAGAQPQGKSAKIWTPNHRQQLEILHQRARSRLGEGYATLLGKHHLFSSVTSEIMESYVSAGDFRYGDGTTYSDVTRIAEVYIGTEAFSYPAAIVDTPGINDQFFIRDEVTYANLTDADIYILVLTAQNPLSSEDLSLLRLLRGLHKEKIVAVINRIDTLQDTQGDGAKIEAYVRGKLQEEFPGVTIPVVQVSALWGNAALKKRSANGDASSTAGPRIDGSCDISSEALLDRAGIPRLVNLIGRLIGNAVTEEQLLPSAATFGALAENTVTASRHGLKNIGIGADSGLQKQGELRKKIRASLEQLHKLIDALDHALSGSGFSLSESARIEVGYLERYINNSIVCFAEDQVALLSEHASPQAFGREFSTAALLFRSELAETFANHYTEIHRKVTIQQSKIEQDLRKITTAILPSLDSVIQFGITSSRPAVPSIISLGRASALENKEFWLENSSINFSKDHEALEDVRSLIISEFLGIAQKMITAAHLELKREIDKIASRLKLIVFSSIFPLVGQLEELASAPIDKGGKNARGSPDPQALRQFQEREEAKAAGLMSLSAELQQAKKQCFLVAAS